ncbi:hypothetical protein N658DRAFT_555781 [Parathielavia hyrcaniae]|uniref:Uncharacterized protein n=1 Tax=Parathielavia hyrcaniae TaxID=113614 RepID=A0AAN6QBI1_9PEZI|nr:hypothetical protein N658DRAFT_555781 [Parathielavia hyrcaniae]
MLQGRDAPSALADDSPEICIRAFSVYGQPSSLAQGLEYPITPRRHDSGGHHIISVCFIAFLSKRDVQSIRAWAKTGEHFVELEWTFPGYGYPKFTTRHVLNDQKASHDLSFSGGLGWALEMMETAEKLSLTSPPAGRPDPFIWNPVDSHASPKPALQPCPFTNRANWSSDPEFSGRPMLHFHGHGKEEVGDFMDGDSDNTWSDTGTSLVFSDLSDDMADHPVGDHSRPEELADGLPSQEHLERRKMEAVEAYALNGDTSGMLAVLASVSQLNRNCYPSEGPRFY